jgi:hypothetical protein
MSEGTWLQLCREALKIPSLLVDIYGDLAKPGVKQVGKAIESVVGFGNTLLWPIALANERARICLERNLDDFRRRMSSVPLEEVAAIPAELGVPLIEKISYVSDENLADLYLSLLATASVKSTSTLVHPSFCHIVEHLSPDEARLLNALKEDDLVAPSLRAEWYSSPPKDMLVEDELSVLLSEHYLSKVAYPDHIPAYIDNLRGLGILESAYGQTLSLSLDPYPEMEAFWMERLRSHRHASARTLRFSQGYVGATLLGTQFVDACKATPREQG